MPTDDNAAASSSPERGGLRPILILLGIFTCGVVAGVAGTRAYGTEEMRHRMENPGDRTKMRLEAMRRQLDLDDKQFAAISAIMTDTENSWDAAVEPCRPALDRRRETVDGKIMEVLSPEQQTKYKELAAKKRRAPLEGKGPVGSASSGH
jgi:Spy/CpxP family protein refolding chaperone